MRKKIKNSIRGTILLTFVVVSFLFSQIALADKVGVVVKFSDNNIVKKCVTVSENSSGYKVLNQTGLNLVWKDYGGSLGHALCKIEDTGCPESNCFCSSNYWGFLYKHYGGEWTYSNVGLDSYLVKDKDIIGLVWGPYGSSLPNISIDEVCVLGYSGFPLPPSAYLPIKSPAPSLENPKGEFRVLINNGEESTFSRKVTLKLDGGSDATMVAIDEDPQFKVHRGLIKYQPEIEWTLSEGEGKKIVYVEFYNEWGKKSPVVSDSIFLKKKPTQKKIAPLSQKQSRARAASDIEKEVDSIRERVIEIENQIIAILKERISAVRKEIDLIKH